VCTHQSRVKFFTLHLGCCVLLFDSATCFNILWHILINFNFHIFSFHFFFFFLLHFKFFNQNLLFKKLQLPFPGMEEETRERRIKLPCPENGLNCTFVYELWQSTRILFCSFFFFCIRITFFSRSRTFPMFSAR
jgi:hypothetical protein